MGLCECDKDTIRIVLDSESNTRSTAENGKYEYDIRLPVKRNTYKKFTLYVDSFNLNAKGLTNEIFLLHSNLQEYNSYNSKSGASNTLLASVANNAVASGRTTDFAINYINSTNGITIQNIPDMLVITIKDIDGTGIDLSDASNVWVLNLRIEAFY